MISSSSASRVLRQLRPPRSPLSQDVADLITEISQRDYCLDFLIAEGDYVFGMGYDEMLKLGAVHRSFAGDATFKTLAQIGRVNGEQWKLYNICFMVKIGDMELQRGAFVFRAFTTGQSRAVYSTIWKMFFRELGRVCGNRIMPSYMLPASDRSSCFQVSSITTDYELAEIEGICCALSDSFGCDPIHHARNMMVGCEVHALRRFLRRSGNKSKKDLYNAMNALRRTKCKGEAAELLGIIEKSDPEWASWVTTDFILPLMVPAFSEMKMILRALSLSSTNVFGSHSAHVNRLLVPNSNKGGC